MKAEEARTKLIRTGGLTQGTIVDGPVNLEMLDLPQLLLRDITFKGGLSVAKAKIGQMTIQSSIFEGDLDMTGLRSSIPIVIEETQMQDLLATKMHILSLSATNLQINGKLDLSESCFSESHECKVTHSKVTGNICLDRTTVTGHTSFLKTEVFSDFGVTDSVFNGSVSLDGMKVHGSLTFWETSMDKNLLLAGCTAGGFIAFVFKKPPICIEVERERANLVHLMAPSVPIVSERLFSCLPYDPIE